MRKYSSNLFDEKKKERKILLDILLLDIQDIFTKEGRVVVRLTIDCVALREIDHGSAHVLAYRFEFFPSRSRKI